MAPRNDDVNNIVVFGGSSGIGLATAQLALTNLPNPNVIIVSSTREKLDNAIEVLKRHKPNAAILHAVQKDLSKFDTQHKDVEDVLKRATETFKAKIDHIVWTSNNVKPAAPQSFSTQDLVKTQTVPLYGPLSLMGLAKTYMNDSPRSSISLTSGVYVYRPMKGNTMVTSMAGSVESSVKSMAVELAPIRVNGMTFGLIQTPLLDAVAARGSAMAQNIAERTLVKSVGEPEDAAEAYIFAMRCAYVTGTMINVEGGFFLA